MLFWNKICGLTGIIFISAVHSYGQQVSISTQPAYKPSYIYFKPVFNLTGKEIKKDEVYLSRRFAVIPQNYYTQHFGIMCRKELALEKATKIPFRFRLGSLQQCNYLEGRK